MITIKPSVFDNSESYGIMRHQSSRLLFDYWDSLRGGRAAPERRDVDPIELKSILADVFFAERTPGAFVMYQFVGTRINAMHGFDLQHRSALGIWSGTSAVEFVKMIERMTTHGIPMVISSEGELSSKEVTEIETLILPLQYGSRFGQFIGTHVNLGKPQAFWGGGLSICEIKSVRPLFSDRTGTQIEDGDGGQVSNEFTNVIPLTKAYGGRRVGHLTVIDGGESF